MQEPSSKHQRRPATNISRTDWVRFRTHSGEFVGIVLDELIEGVGQRI